MKTMLLGAIRLYQRHLSPRKGFRCACHAAHPQRPTCSGFGYRAIARHGAWRGLALLRLRLADCRAISQRLRAQAGSASSRVMPPAHLHSPQAGFIDCDCSGLDCGGSECDAFDAIDCSCDALDIFGNLCGRAEKKAKAKSKEEQAASEE